jgi:hypothetical protein
METSTRKFETALSNPEFACEIVKKDDGYLHVVCTKCKATCTLFPRKQSRSLSGGEARDFYAITCPNCRPSPEILSVLR